MTKVIVRLKGGLGNQFFILFFGLYLKKKYGYLVYFDKNSGFKRDFKYKRKYQLNKFLDDSHLTFLPSYLLDKIYIPLFKIIRRINLFSKLFKIKYLTDSDVNETLDLSNYNIVFADGYFQQIQYFFEVKNEIKHILNHKLFKKRSVNNLSFHLRFYDEINSYSLQVIKKKTREFLDSNSFHNKYKMHLISENLKYHKSFFFIINDYNFKYTNNTSEVEDFIQLINSEVIINIQSSFAMTAILIRTIFYENDKSFIYFPFKDIITNYPNNWNYFNQVYNKHK